eukprot:6277053-Amphidinium_carterae.1
MPGFTVSGVSGTPKIDVRAFIQQLWSRIGCTLPTSSEAPCLRPQKRLLQCRTQTLPLQAQTVA